MDDEGHSQTIEYTRTDVLPSCPGTYPGWTSSTTTIYDSNSQNRNLFDLSSQQWNFAANKSKPCFSSTPGVTVNRGSSTYRYQSVSFDTDIACGRTEAFFECPMTTGESVLYNKTYTLPDCPAPDTCSAENLTDCPSLAVYWQSSQRTITDSPSSYTNRNLFDLSSDQYEYALDEDDSCNSLTPGVSVANGNYTSRYQYVTFDLDIACGDNFTSHFHCPMTFSAKGVDYNRTDNLPACDGDDDTDDTDDSDDDDSGYTPSAEKIALEEDSYHGPGYTYYTGQDSTWYSSSLYNDGAYGTSYDYTYRNSYSYNYGSSSVMQWDYAYDDWRTNGSDDYYTGD